jgi:Ran-binding protein 1
MSASEPTEPKVEETKVEETKPETTPAAEAEGSADKPVTSSSVFSMFGGGAKKEKKDEDEDRGDNSGSAKAQREAAEAAKGDVCCFRTPAELRSSSPFQC